MQTHSTDIVTSVPGLWLAVGKIGLCMLEVDEAGCVYTLDVHFVRNGVLTPGGMRADACFIGPLQRGEARATAKALKTV